MPDVKPPATIERCKSLGLVDDSHRPVPSARPDEQKHNLPQILLKIVTTDEQKHNFKIVTADEQKHNLPQILLKIVTTDEQKHNWSN